MKKFNLLILATLIIAAGCAGWSNENFGRDIASKTCGESGMAHNSYFEDSRRCGGY